MAQVSTEDEDHILWATQGNKGKRQRKRKHFDDMVELGSEGDDLLDKLPPPPVGLSRGEHTKGIQRPQCSGSIKKSSNTMKSGIIENEVHENCASKSGPSSVKINVETNGLGGDNQEGPLPSPIETDDVGGEYNIAALMKREFANLHARLDNMERKNETLSNKLDFVLAFLQNEGLESYSGAQMSSTLDALPTFPLKSVREITTFEGKLLSDEQARKQLKLKVKLIGGASGDAHLRRVLSTLLTNELAYQLTWTGPQHGSKKGGCSQDTMSLRTTKFADTLIAAVMESHCSSNIASLERVAKQWLQHAGDRLKYAEKKNVPAV
ncbi:uncharacterized protein LOC124171636 [Ischnura elegans]|uniref:uncharacterized protein LOC124156549 n=1 Tax=Ischnura elegans TaxID=197161 RepID=UPI001ED87C1C|nr:uncharacterized protein LOC124156549 [Ischnura elegans]XP_046400916.1 uncharacterized protein LOC124167155 [Ischnura elegans]XP_046406795.1 uncharacterized protein LOC124171636 [Ischnura elegans]